MTFTQTPPVARVRRAVQALGAGALAAFGVAHTAAAQNPAGQFTVVTRAGGITFDRAASIETSGLVGIDAVYGFSRYFGIGTAVNVSRANSRAEDFLTALTFGTIAAGDTTFFYQTGQPVNLIDAGLMAVVRLPIGDRIMPYALGGGGIYGMFLDPEINRGRRTFSAGSGTLGGGIAFRFSERAGIQLDVRDLIFFNYDRNRLDPSNNRFPNAFFLEDFPSPPARKKTVHNLAYTIGFRYVPGGNQAGDDAGRDDQ